MELIELKKLVEKRLKAKDLEKEGRKIHDVYSRFLYMKLAYDKLKLPVGEIGKSVKRGHATVINGLKQFDDLFDNRDFKKYKREYLILNTAISIYENKKEDFLYTCADSVDKLEKKYSKQLSDQVLSMQDQIEQMKELMIDEEMLHSLKSLPPEDVEEFKKLAEVFLKRKLSAILAQ